MASLGGALVVSIVSISPTLKLLASASWCKAVLWRSTERLAVFWIDLYSGWLVGLEAYLAYVLSPVSLSCSAIGLMFACTVATSRQG